MSKLITNSISTIIPGTDVLDIQANGLTLNGVPIEGAVDETPISITGTGTETADLSGVSYLVTPTGNISIDFSNPVAGRSYVFEIQQGATPYTVNFIQTILWREGNVFVATNTANAVDIVTIYYNGISYYGNFGLDYQ